MYFLLYEVRSHVPNHTYIHIAPSSATFCCNTDFSQLKRSLILAPPLHQKIISLSTGWDLLTWFCIVSFAVWENHECKVLFSCWWFLCVVQKFNQFWVRHGLDCLVLIYNKVVYWGWFTSYNNLASHNLIFNLVFIEKQRWQILVEHSSSSSSSSVEQESSPTVLSSVGLGMPDKHSCCPQDYVQLKTSLWQLKLQCIYMGTWAYWLAWLTCCWRLALNSSMELAQTVVSCRWFHSRTVLWKKEFLRVS